MHNTDLATKRDQQLRNYWSSEDDFDRWERAEERYTEAQRQYAKQKLNEGKKEDKGGNGNCNCNNSYRRNPNDSVCVFR